jgi:hypothetical protein
MKEEMFMEVRIAKLSMLLDRIVEDNEGSGGEGHEGQRYTGDNNADTKDKDSKGDEENSALLSISAAGIRQSLLVEKDDTKEENRLMSMSEQIKGLSTQVINGHFSITDRMNFGTEISILNEMLDNLEKADEEDSEQMSRLSGKIDNLSRIISSAALYRKKDAIIFALTSPVDNDDKRERLNLAL